MQNLTEPSDVLKNSFRLEILAPTHLTTTYVSLDELFDHVLNSDYQKSL